MFSLLLRGFLLGFAVAASPGPIFFLCVRRTLTQGRLTGLFSGFGVATADGFYAAIATFGVAALTTAFVAGRRREYEEDIDLMHLASEDVVDAVVQPDELRDELILRLAQARTKDREFSRRRHGVPPV